MPTPKALAMRIGGDVVVRRADAAGGEDVVELLARTSLMVATIVASISGMTRHSLTCTPSSPSSVARYWILASSRPAAQDLVADDDDAGGHGFCRGHATLLFLSFRTLAERPLAKRRRSCYAGIACQIWAHDEPPRFRATTATTIGGATSAPSSCTGRKASKACAAPAGWRPRRSTSSRRMSAGRQHRRARQALSRLHPRSQGDPRPARLSRLPEVDLHLDQPCGLPRHPVRQARCRTATSSISTSPPSSTAGTATPAACSSWATSA